MGLLIFLFMLLLIPTLMVLVFVLNLVLRVRNGARNMFGRKSQQEQYQQQQQRPRYDYEGSNNPIEQEIRDDINDRRQRGEKMIPDTEGEYVDFEEIK